MTDDSSGRLTRRYLEGLAHGREAASLLPDTAPFTPEQKAWLSGFLSGLFGRGDAAEPRLNPVRATLREVPVSPPPRAERRVERAVQVEAARSAAPAYDAGNPYAARLLRVDRVPESGEIVCFRVAVDVEGSGIEFAPGDRVGIRRQTEPDKVRDVLRRLSARGQELVPSRDGSSPAWRVLLEEVDIERPTREFVALLTRCARDKGERETLEADRGEPREGMNVAAYLRRFPSARPALPELVRTLHPIEPTLHSIVRSPLADPHSVELLVSRSSQADGRGDLASVVFSELAAGRLHRGDWLPVFVSRRPEWQLPADPSAPVIFVGCGLANVASFHALLDDRALSRADGRNWVFAATESGAGPFHPAFAAWSASRLLTRYDPVHGAVPELLDRLAAERDMLSRWYLDGAVVYVAVPPPDLDRVTEALSGIVGGAGRQGAERLRSVG